MTESSSKYSTSEDLCQTDCELLAESNHVLYISMLNPSKDRYAVIGTFIIFIFYTLGALQVVSILIPIFKDEKTEAYRGATPTASIF